MTVPLLCRQVTRRFGDLVAVNNVDLEVHDQEIFGIIGPNGAGKTTLLNCVESLDVPTSGSIEVLGFDPRKDQRKLVERTGIQLQQAALPPRLKVGEVLQLFSSFYDHVVPWKALLDTLGIGDKKDSFVDKLSGGERQRVFIALALIHDPELLFLDELTTALDPQARLAMWDVVRDIQSRGKTVVLTTHYMEEAEALCDRVAIIDKGSIIAVDTVPNLISTYGGDSVLKVTLDKEAPDLNSVEGVSKVRQKGAVTEITGRGAFEQNVLAHLTQAGVKASDLSTTAPGLEEVFLAVAGHEIRKEEQA